MAIPRRVGLPTKPPAAQNDTNSPETPVKRPVSQDNNNNEQRPVRRENAPQKRENQTPSTNNEQDRQRKNLQQSSKPQRRVSQSSEQNTSTQNEQRRKEASQKQASTKIDNVSNRQKRSPENNSENNTNNTNNAVEEGYAIDEETGIKYKVLPGAKPEAVKKFNSMKKSDIDNLTFSSMKYFFTEAEDFDIEDLNSTANDFLGHLRVPPDKEEQKRLREARAQRMKAQEEAYKKNEEILNKKYGSLEPDDLDDE